MTLSEEQKQKRITELKDMSRDILAHPEDDLSYLEDIFKSEVFTDAEIQDINEAFRLILSSEYDENKKGNMIENSWKLNFVTKPPTPEEFCTEEWIGGMAESLFPYIKNTFCNFYDPIKPYRHLVLSYPIGSGKTTLVVLQKAYNAILYNFLRNPKQFFHLSKATLLTDVSVSLTKSQCYTLVIDPLKNLLLGSPRFEYCRYQNEIEEKRSQNPRKVYFANSNSGMAVFRIGELRFITCSEPYQLLGTTITNFSITEMAFLQEAGMTEETAMRLLNDGKGRVYSRFGNSYFARTILDSSPNDLSSSIDQYIFNKAPKDPTVLFVNDTKWNLQPHLFPEWQRTGETFPVFLGDVSKTPKILDKEEVKNYDVTEIMNMPIDIRSYAEDSLIKVIKDYGGKPSGSEKKLINNMDIIEDIFTDSLRNTYSPIYAPASLPPENLLWDYVKKEFFVYTGHGNIYKFWRNPYATRFISVDLAKNHDMASISMVHIEMGKNGERLYIVDFSIPVISGKEEINMDAFRYLIINMVKYGQITIGMSSTDHFQSDSHQQYLKRFGIESQYFSVDQPVEVYLSFLNNLSQRRIKAGRNLIFKNNLKCLIMSQTPSGKKKVDHLTGSWTDIDNLDWTYSKWGYFGKDVADSICASCTLADMYGTLTADYIYDEENEKLNNTTSIEVITKDLEELYGLKLLK